MITKLLWGDPPKEIKRQLHHEGKYGRMDSVGIKVSAQPSGITRLWLVSEFDLEAPDCIKVPTSCLPALAKMLNDAADKVGTPNPGDPS